MTFQIGSTSPDRDLNIRSVGEVEMTAVEFAGLSDLEWVRSYQH